MHFRDIYDHLAHVESLTESMMNLDEGVLNTYLAAVSTRQNEVTKVLSVMASIFLPLTMLASIYGMNFQNMPRLQWPALLPISFLSLMAFLVTCFI